MSKLSHPARQQARTARRHVASSTAGNEAATCPPRSIWLGNRWAKVREYQHGEWLALLSRVEPLIAALAARVSTGEEPTYELALDVLAANHPMLLPLVAQAADLPPSYVAELPPDDGELLLMTWWGVNGRFFVSRALNRVSVREGERKARTRA